MTRCRGIWQKQEYYWAKYNVKCCAMSEESRNSIVKRQEKWKYSRIIMAMMKCMVNDRAQSNFNPGMSRTQTQLHLVKSCALGVVSTARSITNIQKPWCIVMIIIINRMLNSVSELFFNSISCIETFLPAFTIDTHFLMHLNCF
jgi:hypothetical protein